MAVDLPEPIRAELLHLMDKQTSISGMRWLQPENLHLTLKFLGEVSQESMESLKQAVSMIAHQFGPLSLELSKGGVFPNTKNPKVFWIGVEGETERLVDLSKKINRRLQDLGYPGEADKFIPHLTVGRLPHGISSQRSVTIADQFCKLIQTYRSPKFMVKEFHFFQSHLRGDGVRYEVLTSFQLGAS